MNSLHETRLKIRRELEAPPTLRKFGSGWISGVLGLVFGFASLGFVVMMRLPGVFIMKEDAAFIGSPGFRIGLLFLMMFAFGFSFLNLLLRPGKALGFAGIIATLLAVTFGGTSASAVAPDLTPFYFGLDFFILRLLFTGFLFIPLETLSPHRAEQGIFRQEWREDLFYYLVSSLMVQVLTWLSFMPAQTLFKHTSWAGLRAWIAALPFIVQLLAIMFLTDLVQYWVHRLFHRIPALWRFHAVHHSAQSMDWMAGARMHFFEILVLRGTTVFPMILLGFSQTAVNAYVLVVYLFATFAHSNLGWKLPLFERVFVTPRFHHWHHGIEKEAIDVNFAIHFPLFDKLFGTHHMPENNRWPEAYGISGHPVPPGYWQQFLHPFRRKKK